MRPLFGQSLSKAFLSSSSSAGFFWGLTAAFRFLRLGSLDGGAGATAGTGRARPSDGPCGRIVLGQRQVRGGTFGCASWQGPCRRCRGRGFLSGRGLGAGLGLSRRPWLCRRQATGRATRSTPRRRKRIAQGNLDAVHLLTTSPAQRRTPGPEILSPGLASDRSPRSRSIRASAARSTRDPWLQEAILHGHDHVPVAKADDLAQTS